jgi:hypothetical protein
VAIAQSIGPHTTTGAILLYIAPAATFVTGAILYYIEVQASRYLEKRAISSARKTLVRQLNNPRLSNEHKAQILKMLENLEMSEATWEIERVKIMRLTPPSFTE